MKLFKVIFSFTLFLFLHTSCGIVNKAYVPTNYEPLLLSEKKDSRISLSQSSSFTKLQISYAIKDNLGVSLAETVVAGVSNTEFMVVRFKQKDFFYYEFGGGMGFQENNIRYDGRPRTFFGYSGLAADSYTTEKINSTYQSLFLTGAVLFGEKTQIKKFGVALKIGPSYIYNYSYYFNSFPYEGKQHEGPFDNETFHFKNEFFLAAEPSLLYLKQKSRGILRVQLGYMLNTYAYEHDYYFFQWYSGTMINATKNHPDVKALTFSIGFIWNIHSTIHPPPEKKSVIDDFNKSYNE